MTYAADGIDDWIIQRFPEGHVGHCLDVGAYDGVTRSNTLLLEQKGWTVLCVEPNSGVQFELNANRMFVAQVALSDHEGWEDLHVHEPNEEAYTALKVPQHKTWRPDPEASYRRVQVRVRTADSLLSQWEFPKLDAVSIDTEGTELDVLKGLDLEKWRPRVLVIECWDADGPVDRYLKERGYRMVERRHVNNLFERVE